MQYNVGGVQCHEQIYVSSNSVPLFPVICVCWRQEAACCTAAFLTALRYNYAVINKETNVNPTWSR